MNSRLIYLILCLIILLGVFATTKLEFEADLNAYDLVSEKDAENYKKLNQHFNSPDAESTIIIIEKSTGWKDINDFKLLDSISKFWENDFSVSSITNLKYPRKHVFGISKKLFVPLNSNKKFKKWYANKHKYNDILTKFISSNNSYTLLFLNTSGSNITTQKTQIAANYFENKDVKFHFLQPSLIEEELGRSSIQDAVIIGVTCLLLVLITFFILTQSLKGLGFIALIILFNLSITLLIMVGLNIPFSIYMISIPCILLVLSFTDIMHILYHHKMLITAFSNKTLIRNKLIQLVHLPIVLTSLTNIIGFTVFLIVSENDLLFELSLISIIGVLVSYFSSRYIVIQLLPTHYSFINKTLPILKGQYKVIKCSPKLKSLTKGVFVLVSICVSFWVLSFTTFNISDTDYISTESELFASRKLLSEHFFGNKQGEIIMESKEGILLEEEKFRSITILENKIDSLFNTNYISSPNLLAKRYNRFLHKGFAGGFYIPKKLDPKFIENLRVNKGKLGGDNILSDNLEWGKIQFGFVSKDLNTSLTWYKKLDLILSELSSDKLSISFTGKQILGDKSSLSFLNNLLFGFLIALLTASGLLFLIALKKDGFKKSLLLSIGVLCVNVLPITIAIFLMNILSVPINPIAIFFLSILLGICLDDSIYITTQHFQKNKKLHFFPISVTSLVLLFGFLALGFSNFSFLQPFAWIFGVGILFAFILDVFVLPIFLDLSNTSKND